MTEIDFDHPPADPITQVQRWVDEATEQTDLPNPSAMTLATVDGDGRPSARVVLLRGLDERGAVFYTNYESRKGADLVGNPRAALVMHWDALERQVRMEGTVTKTSDEESDAYFAQRPLTSQLGAWASEQSKPLASRADLEAQVEVYIRRFIDGHVPRPPHWGGYRVELDRIELWQGRVHRLHDRIEYVRDGDVWVVRRLCP